MTTVGNLGMTHDENWQRKYQFLLSLVGELINEFKPDVICGEVHPDSWEHYLRGGKHKGIWGETQNLCFHYAKKKY
ncbi:hypothetical protein [Bacillus sp. 2205SS5-2]|uniref:hypothetical protein n=1 Tax=Bacillus sp. 2205SS5-2 TaxID=3109031 RepID=UPI003003DFF9